MSDTSAELERIYSTRFLGQELYREQVWRILIHEFFTKWIPSSSRVLDLGCGYGEFINNVPAAVKFAVDLNPSVRSRLASDVQLFEQDCSTPWPLGADSLDIVFSSNFFEHLPTKHLLRKTLEEAYRCLKPGGRLIALGPNIKLLHGEYWNFFDHYLPLTELSLAEVLSVVGFQIDRSIARFLPYTMSQGLQPPLWSIRLYLKIPFLWAFFGRQFLVVATKGK